MSKIETEFHRQATIYHRIYSDVCRQEEQTSTSLYLQTVGRRLASMWQSATQVCSGVNFLTGDVWWTVLFRLQGGKWGGKKQRKPPTSQLDHLPGCHGELVRIHVSIRTDMHNTLAWMCTHTHLPARQSFHHSTLQKIHHVFFMTVCVRVLAGSCCIHLKCLNPHLICQICALSPYWHFTGSENSKHITCHVDHSVQTKNNFPVRALLQLLFFTQLSQHELRTTTTPNSCQTGQIYEITAALIRALCIR